MSDTSNKYGYVGAENIPVQSFGNNAGIFSANDIYDLTREDKWTNYGQLELIETQIHSTDVSEVDFTNIKADIYDVHFMTLNNIVSSSDAGLDCRLSDDNGTTFESGSYDYDIQFVQTSGTSNGETRSTGGNAFTRLGALGANANEQGNGYMYFYNLGDSTKYSFATHQSSSWNFNAHLVMYFGSLVYHQTVSMNALRVFPTAGSLTDFEISLYGIKSYE